MCKRYFHFLPSFFSCDWLTSHGAETETLLIVIVCCGAAPFHPISTSFCGAVSVVLTIIDEWELTQSSIGITTTCYHKHCKQGNKTVCQTFLHNSVELGFIYKASGKIQIVSRYCTGTQSWTTKQATVAGNLEQAHTRVPPADAWLILMQK